MAGIRVLNVSSMPDMVWVSTATRRSHPGGGLLEPVPDRLVGVRWEHPVGERGLGMTKRSAAAIPLASSMALKWSH